MGRQSGENAEKSELCRDAEARMHVEGEGSRALEVELACWRDGTLTVQAELASFCLFAPRSPFNAPM
jgi:hypothetical protein